MENASKALIIAGAILLAILIIGIGMYIYSSSHNTLESAKDQMSEQDKTSFNQQWNTYEGAQGGNTVKTLLQKIIANCNTNAQEAQRLVDVFFAKGTDTNDRQNIQITVANAKTDNGAISALTTLRNSIEARHTYFVNIEYSGKTSLVNRIIIRYDEKDDQLPQASEAVSED